MAKVFECIDQHIQRWIAAQTDSRVDRIVLRPGAIVKPDSIILELSDPELQRNTLDAEFQLKGA